MDKIYYERNLPHWHPPGATFFLTYRLAGSIPLAVLRQMKEDSDELLKLAEKTLQGATLEAQRYQIQRRFFGQYDAALDTNPNGPYWLRESAVAELVIESLRFCAEKHFHLWAFCIMPNHVHVLLKHHPEALLMSKILQSHKGFTGQEANKLLGRNGKFWHRETYDHVVRDQNEFDRIARYILNNPVKAKLVDKWEDWPYTYAHPELWQ